ncbi:MAG: nidogen-like domain-containing protein [Paracoccaceae bacterium]
MANITGNGTAIKGLGGAAGFGETMLPRGDDVVVKANVSAAFGAGFTIGGRHYDPDQLYISTDGIVSFGAGFSGVAPDLATMTAPFFAIFNGDADTRLDGEGAESGAVWLDVDAAQHCVTITWDHVGFYRRNASHTDTFQMQIFDRGEDSFDVVYRYQNIGWTAGDLQGGWGGLGGIAARIGYRLAASGAVAEHLASGNGNAELVLPQTLGNTGVAGLWKFSSGPEINGTTASNTLNGTAGCDLMHGLAGNDRLIGNAGNDRLYGGAGADTVQGGDDDDRLSGGAGNDALTGGNGADRLDGGAGNDTLTGGAGADRFYTSGQTDSGRDWIMDFSNAAGDSLVFGIAGATSANFRVTYTKMPGIGDATVAEALVYYIPKAMLVWTIVDGADDGAFIIHSSTNFFDDL